MGEWLKGVTMVDGRIIPVVFSSPMRAFSTLRTQLSESGIAIINPPDDAQLEYSDMPLPYVSFWRGDPKFGVRRNQNFPVRNIGFISSSGQRRTGSMRYPTPVNIPYQVEIWCKSISTQGYLVQKMMEQFWTHLAYWSVQTPYGTRVIMPIKMNGMTDTSELEAGSEARDRILRYTFNLEVEGKMFHDIKEVPTYMRQSEQIVVDGVVVKDVNIPLTDLAPPSLEEQAASTVNAEPES